MQSLRQSAIPLEYIPCELAAAPFCSLAAFEHNLQSLRADCGGQTGAFWRAVEPDLRVRLPAFRLDEIVAFRDLVWFSQSSWVGTGAAATTTAKGELPLHALLRRVAEGTLETAGTHFEPRPAPWSVHDHPHGVASPGLAARHSWRWLSLSMPADLVVAAARRHPSAPCSVEICTRALDRRLREQGFAESHLHIGAALEFPLLWISMLVGLMDLDAPPNIFAGVDVPFDDGRQFAPWLLRAAVARCLLAEFLAQTANSDFDEFVGRRLARFEDEHGPLTASPVGPAVLELVDGQFGCHSPSFARLRAAYRLLAPRTGCGDRRIASLAAFPEADPIHTHFPGGSLEAPCEVLFVTTALHHIEGAIRSGKPDVLFQKVFWQVIRLRCALFRQLTQRPQTAGLPWFFRFFQQISAVRLPVRRSALLQAAQRNAGPGLRCLEFRTTPDREVGPMLDLVACQAEQTPGIERALVLHFTRHRGGGLDSGKPSAHGLHTSADPRLEGNAGYRHRAFYLDARRRARAIARLLQQNSFTLQHLRGIDACSDELAVPTWVIAPLFRYLRDVSCEVSSSLRRWHGVEVPPLFVTVHAGEDYLHVMGGLRRIDEAIDHLRLREGDRLGHALALGCDIATWARQSGVVAVSREERLLDLTWEWSFSHDAGVELAAQRHLYLETQIHRLSDEIFGNGLTPTEMAAVVACLHEESFLRRAAYAAGAPEAPADGRTAVSLAHRYLRDAEVFVRGQEAIRVEPESDREALVNLQAALIRKVAARGLLVEINPSSNLLIGHLGELRNHPVFNLLAADGRAASPSVGICLGSDDPSTFATRLRAEFQYMQDAAVSATGSTSDGAAWLDRLRATGLDARFSVVVDPSLPPSKLTHLPMGAVPLPP